MAFEILPADPEERGAESADLGYPGIGSVGDYQPAERKFGLSRRMLEVCYDLGFPVFMKPAYGGGWRDVYKVETPQEFFAWLYDQISAGRVEALTEDEYRKRLDGLAERAVHLARLLEPLADLLLLVVLARLELEERLLELRRGGEPSEPVKIAFKTPFTSYFTATVRAGSPPSNTLDLLGHREGAVPFSYIGPDGKPIGFSFDLCMKFVDKIKAGEEASAKVLPMRGRAS